jgi:XTP/dITP diphosphohydrolase
VIDRLVLATQNKDKVKEIQELLGELNIRVLTVNELPDAPVVEEDGRTLEENAAKKARVIAEYTQLPAVGDDTGLEVDYLEGAPGVYSSRYSGENATYEDNVRKLLTDLEGVPPESRQAQFRCVVAFHADGKNHFEEGVCKGVITESPRGNRGFGYDPVFYVPEYDCTFAEMDLSLKNKISHRARAFLALKKYLKQIGA